MLILHMCNDYLNLHDWSENKDNINKAAYVYFNTFLVCLFLICLFCVEQVDDFAKILS